MALFKVYKDSDWNVRLSDPTILKDGWWKLSELYKEQYGEGYLRVDWNIINKEDIFLGFLHHITGLKFKKIEEGIYQNE